MKKEIKTMTIYSKILNGDDWFNCWKHFENTGGLPFCKKGSNSKFKQCKACHKLYEKLNVKK